MEVCYRHPDRETGVACSNCGRPICPDCMTPTPVGMRCPECARQRTRVRTARTLTSSVPRVTGALIATTNPLTETVGASGAIFGLMGAAVVMMRARGISIMESGVGGLLVLNLAFSFLFSGISIGGHIGGLVGG